MADQDFSAAPASTGFSDFLDTPSEPLAFEPHAASGFQPSYEETPGAPFADNGALAGDDFASTPAPTSNYSNDFSAADTSSNAYDNFSGEKRSSAASGFTSEEKRSSNYDNYRSEDTGASSFTAAATYDNFSDNPLSIYRREHAEFLEKKDAKSEDARLDLLAKARTTQQEFTTQRTEKNAKRAQKNREDEKKYIADRDAILEGSNYSNDWERVGALVDFKAPTIGRDTNRMRKLLIELKH